MSTNKTFNKVQLDVKFTQATTRANITSEENISLSFGKLNKWYEALVPTGGSSGQILGWNSSGTAKWINHTHPTITVSADTTSTPSQLAHSGTFTAITSVTRDSNGHVKTLNTKTYTLPASGVPSNNVTGSGTSGYLAKWSGTNTIDKTGKITYIETDNAASTPAKRAGLLIESTTYGNTAATMLGGVAGIFQYGDGGPQISFKDLNSTQAGALIFTADDSAATGASWHFVSNQADWNVISNRFHAKTAISIGTTKPNTSYASYALHVTGTANITGNVTFGGSVTATTFTGNLSGNATTADKFKVSRVNEDSKSFPGKCLGIIKEYQNNASNNLPTTHWYHIMSLQGEDTRYGTQFALGMSVDGVYYRRYDASTWGSWIPIGRFTANPTTGQVVITDGTTGGVKSSGYTIATSVPSNALFTDANVIQTPVGSTYTNYRPLLIGNSSGTSAGFTPTLTTAGVYATAGIYCQPSSGYVYASEFMTNTYPSGTGSSLSQYGLYLKSYFKCADSSQTVLQYAGYGVRTYSGKITSSDGIAMAVGCGGLTVLGSGESAHNLISLISDDQKISGNTTLNVGGTLNTTFVGNSEVAIVSSDENIYFITNCQAIANRKPVCLDTNSYFYPGTNNTGSIGTSSYKWASMYATTFYGSLSGTASKAVLLDHKSLDSTTINNTAGSFAFSGVGEPWAGTDWVGLQIGDNNDKWQLTGTGSVFLWRQNDSGGTDSANWSAWKTFLDSSNYTTYTVKKDGTGASGSWGISVTGSSASCTGNAATATSATRLSNQRDVAITYGANKLEWYDLSANNGTDVTKKQNPTNDWYHHITMHHSNSNGYFVDLALCFHSNNISYRRVAAGANSSGGWIRLIDSANIADQSVASAIKASQDGDGNAINTTYLKRSGGTMTGLLTLYRESTTANNYPAGITFSLKDTTTGKQYSGAWLYAYQDHQSEPYGTNIVLNPGGGLFIGSGESPANHYSAKGSTYTGEDTFITADNTVFIQANGNTIANRLGFYINGSHEVLPCKAETATNNVGTLGNSSYNWKSVYATNIYGTHNGKVMSSSIILRQHDNYQAGIGYDTKGNECIALWAKNTVTRLRWYAGTDMTTMTSGLMMDKTPDFEVSKADGSPRVYVGGFEIGVCYIMYDEASGTATTVSNLNIPAGTKYFKIFIYDANTSGSNNVTNVIDIGVADGHYGGIISGGLQAQSFPCVITAVQFIVSTSNSLKSITLGKSSSWTIGSSPSSGSHTLYIRKIIACT